jgi:hypothetical protein
MRLIGNRNSRMAGAVEKTVPPHLKSFRNVFK